MYSGRPRRSVRAQRVGLGPRRRRTTYATSRCSPGTSSRATHHRLAHARVLAQRAPRSRPARCGSRAPSPGRRCGPGTRACRPAGHRARSPVRYSRAPGSRRTGRGRSAPPSARAGPGSRAPPARRRCTARRARPTGTGCSARVQHVDARVRDRPADGHGTAASPGARSVAAGGADRRLGGAVEVDERRVRDARASAAAPARAASASPLHTTCAAAARVGPAPRCRQHGQRRRSARRRRACIGDTLPRSRSGSRGPARHRADAPARRRCSSGAEELRTPTASKPSERRSAAPRLVRRRCRSAPRIHGQPVDHAAVRRPSPPWGGRWSRRCRSRTPGAPASTLDRRVRRRSRLAQRSAGRRPAPAPARLVRASRGRAAAAA